MTDEAILIVDDEQDIARGMQRLLAAHYPDTPVLVSYSGREALDILKARPIAVMVTDMRMPHMGGLELLEQALAASPHLSVVVHTAYGSISTAVQALQKGAYDFITKPTDPDDLVRVVDKGLERSRLIDENRRLRALVAQRELGGDLIGESRSMRRLKEQIAAVAGSDYTVLIRGDSGVGKELAARAVHALSARAAKPLVTVNCSAIPANLMESELFGHVKGAFTGADRTRRGLFLHAQGGTLLLDEIGDIPVDIQAKLLRVLQEGEVRPVGSSQSTKVDVRVVASTNRDLEAMIEAETFREDLFYRLNVLTLSVPPLRERPEDIPALAQHFLHATAEEMACAEAPEITAEALAWLATRPWPGNARELQNFMRKLAVFCSTGRIDVGAVRFVAGTGGSEPAGHGVARPYKDAKEEVLAEFTRAYMKELLTASGGNVSEAARLSGLERVSLQKILKRYDIDAAAFRA